MADRTVHTRWDGGMRAVTQVGDFEVVVDEPETAGGTDTGPQPTDLLLVSVSSCFALALAFVARKRGVDLLGLDVTAIGRYEGLKFCEISLSISSDSPRSVVEDLLPEAQRVCYVSNTLQRQPELTVEVT
ncbi:MAG TPA: OsmC family protein [Propionibacteriaceae bacterium]|jgi:putative redox protein|nr:OsmC family protein [Propionibacteriaceae bacterium]HJQ89831.1 OsmC family protein [Propionibacteriaceae bacterium]